MIGVDFDTVDKILADNKEAIELLKEAQITYQKGLLVLVAENERKLFIKQAEIDQLQANHASMLRKKSEKIEKLENTIYGLEGKIEELTEVKKKSTSALGKLSYVSNTIAVGLLIASAASSFTGIGVAIAPLLLIAGAVFAAIGLGLNLIDSKRKTSTVFKDTQRTVETNRILEA